jgi:beta-glucosidase
MKKILQILILGITITSYCFAQTQPAYKNTSLPVDERVADLVSRMTVEEKISQMSHLAPGIERLDIIPYEPNFENPLLEGRHHDYTPEEHQRLKETRAWENYEHWETGKCFDGGWWSSSLHGVGRSGLATSFPQCIGMGSTWNPDLVHKAFDATSTEARIHSNVYGKKLSYWSPTINILRDPRWGRNEESFSEDPYLLSRMAVAVVKGMQGDDPKYLKTIATIKHFVANNSEFNRHNGTSNVSERFLREYYFPAYKYAIMEAGAFSVMNAYNAVNGIPTAVDKWLLTGVLRDEWGFEGYVVSDCGAVSDIVHQHKYETDPEKAVALAVKAGLDLECETCETEQFLYDNYLPGAFEKGYITEEEIDIAVKRLFKARMLVGEFDPPEDVPYTKIPREKLDSQEHRDLAVEVARQSIILLKNDNLLPLDQNEIKKVAVIGPNANICELGGYSGMPAVKVSPLMGIKDYLGENYDVEYKMGCAVTSSEEEAESINEAVVLAKNSDVALLFVGTNLTVANEHFDRSDLDLPGNQLKLVKEVYKANPKTIVVLINGMALTIDWLDKNVPSIIEAWYPGQAGGTAIAEVIFGAYNPGGKLPVTFYRNFENLAPIDEYDITKGHSYWFYEGEVLYPFGYGLSYTTFEYSNFNVDRKIVSVNGENKIKVSVDIKNTGKLKGDEIVQVYIKDLESSVIQPRKRLKKFERISLESGETKTVSFELKNEDFSYWDENIKNWKIEEGDFEIQIAASLTDIKFKELVKAED